MGVAPYWKKARSAAAAAAAAVVVESGRLETILRERPRSRRTTAWQPSPKWGVISSRLAVMPMPSTEGVYAAEESVTVDREVRAVGEIGSGELMKKPRLRRPRPDWIHLPR